MKTFLSLIFIPSFLFSVALGSGSEEPAAVETKPASESSTPQAAAKIQALLDAKRFPEALKELEFALKSSPKVAELLKHKGFALREMKKYDEAVTAYLDALKINPELHTAKEYLAVTYLRMGETKPAQQLYKELQKSSPELAKMLVNEAKKLKVKL